MNARWVIDKYLELRSRLTSPPSPLGFHLAILRARASDEKPDPNAEQIKVSKKSYQRMFNQEDSRLLFVHLTYLIGASGLSDLEQRVLFALRTPKEHENKCQQNIGLRCSCGAVRYYLREVREGDLHLHLRDGDETIQETHHGEHYHSKSPRDGFVIVEGTRPIYPTREEVAALLKITFAEVKESLRRATRKIESSAKIDALEGER